jgi:hypothetical protein
MWRGIFAKKSRCLAATPNIQLLLMGTDSSSRVDMDTSNSPALIAHKNQRSSYFCRRRVSRVENIVKVLFCIEITQFLRELALTHSLVIPIPDPERDVYPHVQ